jgi:predicted transcriptional regulator
MLALKAAPRMKSVHIRLPASIRAKARDIARRSSKSDVRVTESAVYRSIIIQFFEREGDYELIAD